MESFGAVRPGDHGTAKQKGGARGCDFVANPGLGETAGWRRVLNLGPDDPGPERGGVAAAFMGWFLGLTAVYGALFGTGFVLYGNLGWGLICLAIAGSAMAGIFRVLPRIGS